MSRGHGFEGRSVLVTGAGGGIGRAVVRKLAGEGAKIIVADANIDAADQAVEDAREISRDVSVWALPGDLTDAGYCDTLPGEAAALAGGLDVLINNAGLMRRGNILEATDEDFALSMAVNVEAPFRLSRAAIAIMKEQGSGAIVNTASCWGISPGPNHLVYCATKATVAAMTRCLARDHAGDGIRVNAVCPNEVNTPMLRSGFAIRGLDPDKAVADLNASVPLGRIAEPEEIADVITYLASDSASYVCGALLEVNGAKPVG